MEQKIFVLDTETTGISTEHGDRVIEIGCVELIKTDHSGYIITREYHQYINPGDRFISRQATAVHGITNKMLEGFPLFAEIAESFLNFVGQEHNLVIHNAPFDIKFLNSELGRLKSFKLAPARAIDTLKIAKKKFPGSPVSLDALCKRFKISLAERSKHGALIDAKLLAQVYLKLAAADNLNLNLNPEKEAQKQQAFFPPRHFALTQEEQEAHRALIAQIPNAIWHKIQEYA